MWDEKFASSRGAATFVLRSRRKRRLEGGGVSKDEASISAYSVTVNVNATGGAALGLGADDVGICAFRPEWTYTDRERPAGDWVIVLGFGHEYANMKNAPCEDTYIEVMKQYGRAGGTAKHLANWIRERGFVVSPR